MKKQLIFLLIFMQILVYSQNRLERNLVGHWTFDDTANPLEAAIGNDLILEGSHTIVDGPEAGDGAVNIGAGSYYNCKRRK